MFISLCNLLSRSKIDQFPFFIQKKPAVTTKEHPLLLKGEQRTKTTETILQTAIKIQEKHNRKEKQGSTDAVEVNS